MTSRSSPPARARQIVDARRRVVDGLARLDFADAEAALADLAELWPDHWQTTARNGIAAIVRDPVHATGLNGAINASALLHDLGAEAEAAAVARDRLALDPDHPALLINLATALDGLEAVDVVAEAEFLLRRALDLAPQIDRAWLILAGLLLKRGAKAEALDILRRLAADPAWHAEIPKIGVGSLLRGDWTTGLDLYELRPLLTIKGGFARIPAPFWSQPGLPPPGTRLLLHPEQGAGDLLMLMRYPPRLAAAGLSVTLAVPPGFAPLLASVPGLTLASRADIEAAPDRFDRQARLMSLPFLTGATPDRLPPAEPPYLAADPVRIRDWATRLQLGQGRLTIGVKWEGNRASCMQRRFLPVEWLLPLAETGARLISLEFAQPTPPPIETVPDLDRDGAFLDTAAIMAGLDLIVTADTAIVHLAGALNRPTALLLAEPAEWRWLRNRDDTPWYRSVRLYRQPVAEDWATPIDRLIGDIRAGNLPGRHLSV